MGIMFLVPVVPPSTLIPALHPWVRCVCGHFSSASCAMLPVLHTQGLNITHASCGGTEGSHKLILSSDSLRENVWARYKVG